MRIRERFKDLMSSPRAVTDALKEIEREPLSAETIAEISRALSAAHDQGVTLFDHADIYMNGKSEEAFGAWLKESGLRDKVVIQSKCGIRFQSDPGDDDPNRFDFSRDHILRSVEGILKRLGTDRLDLLLLHRPDALVEPHEVAEAFDRLKDAGKVRHFGVSNHTVGQIELLRRYVRQPIVVNQLQLGLGHPYLILDGMEANQNDDTRISHAYLGSGGILDYCRLNDIQVHAWSPLKCTNGLDLWTKDIDPDSRSGRAAALMDAMAKAKGVGRSAIALAWLLRHPAGIVPVIGASQPDHIKENCDADGVELTREEWYRLLAAGAGVDSLQLLGIVHQPHA
jgi:predicted oxidoreductase